MKIESLADAEAGRAPVVPGHTYPAGPRSVVVLFAEPDPKRQP
jgi:hypothetical protein